MIKTQIGLVAQWFPWQFIFLLLSVVALCFGIWDYFFLPETLNPNAPKRSINPLTTLRYLFHPPITVMVRKFFVKINKLINKLINIYLFGLIIAIYVPLDEGQNIKKKYKCIWMSK